MDTEPRKLTPRSDRGDTGRAADATFQWPPPQDEGSEPLQADGTLTAEPGKPAATQPVSGIAARVPDPAEAPYLELQEALRKRQTAAESIGKISHPAEIGPERPALSPPPNAGLQSHRQDVAPAPRAQVAQPLRQPTTAAQRTEHTNYPVRKRLEDPGLRHRSGA